MTEKTLKQVLRILLWVLLGVSLIIAISFVVKINGAEDRLAEMSAVNLPIVWAYILVGLAAVLTIVFPLVFIVQYPRKAIKLLISVAILAVILLISYFLADDTPIRTATSGTNPDFADRGVLVFTDMGIITTYILIAIALLLLVFTGVRSFFRVK